jgi:hypothetical protein
MPRPTRPQVFYGSATVVFSTLTMLLLSEARSTGAVLAVVIAGLTLGMLVAVMADTPLSAQARSRAGQRRSQVPATTAVPRAHVPAATPVSEPREHSLQP